MLRSTPTRTHCLKPPVAGLIRRIAVRQVGPPSAGPQDPQNAIEHGVVLPPRAPSTVLSARQFGQEATNEVPLLVGEVTGMRRIKGGHPATMAPRHTAIDADEPSVQQRRRLRLLVAGRPDTPADTRWHSC
jgi:hypothetical protein